MTLLPEKKIRHGVSRVHHPSLQDIFRASNVSIDTAIDIGGNLVPVGEVVLDRFEFFPRVDIDSIVEPAEVISRLINDVNIIRDTCKAWIARFESLESVDAEYLVFAVDHVAAVLRTVLHKVLGETYP